MELARRRAIKSREEGQLHMYSGFFNGVILEAKGVLSLGHLD